MIVERDRLDRFGVMGALSKHEKAASRPGRKREKVTPLCNETHPYRIADIAGTTKRPKISRRDVAADNVVSGAVALSQSMD